MIFGQKTITIFTTSLIYLADQLTTSPKCNYGQFPEWQCVPAREILIHVEDVSPPMQLIASIPVTSDEKWRKFVHNYTARMP